MKITKAEYTASAVNPKQYPAGSQPEIALAGRSNVGKSSLINKFINRKALARTSSVPGKTQTLNFYNINDAWYFVDLPGYGYAKVSKDLKSSWGKFIEDYLTSRPQLRGIIQILDIRHSPSKEDKEMFKWIQYRGLPYLVVITKADKISKGQWKKSLDLILRELGGDETPPAVLFSAETGEGLEYLHEWAEGLLKV